MTSSFTTLDNGLKILHLPYEGEVEYFGMIVNAGSRDEDKGSEGLAHFVEHTIFKGTPKRKFWHISNRMEQTGGELNAYTTKEETAIYSIFPFGNLTRAVELIGDIVTNSVFPTKEIEKEKSVIEEEIQSYLDSPSEDIYDKFDSLIFKDSALSHNILGETASVQSFDSDDCIKWLHTKFTPGRTVVFYMGKTSPGILRRSVEKYFGDYNRENEELSRCIPPVMPIFRRTLTFASMHQCHNLYGIRIPGLYSSLRPTYALISNILGGPGMNSILNMEMREKSGLVYTVETSIASYTDCGLLTIYYGCDASDEEKCRAVLKKSIDRLSKGGINRKKLMRAKEQFKGQMILSFENHEQDVLSSARSMLHRNRPLSLSESLKSIDSISYEQFEEVLWTINPDSLSQLTLKRE